MRLILCLFLFFSFFYWKRLFYLPGATKICWTLLDWESLQAIACSRPPAPTRRILSFSTQVNRYKYNNKNKLDFYVCVPEAILGGFFFFERCIRNKKERKKKNGETFWSWFICICVRGSESDSYQIFKPPRVKKKDKVTYLRLFFKIFFINTT